MLNVTTCKNIGITMNRKNLESIKKKNEGHNLYKTYNI